jgi:hypothetical protein
VKIFISWSGERSHRVAQLLDNWIRCVIQAVDPWISSKDIDKGSLWFSEITDKLSTTQNGIVCLTSENIDHPWILFEAGALAKGLTTNRVFTFLIDLEPKDIKDPLAQFNHTLPQKDSLYQLLSSINKGLLENALKESILKNVFDTYWVQFEKDFTRILTDTPVKKIKEGRPQSDLLSEILYSVRGMDRRLRDLEFGQHGRKEEHIMNMTKLLSTSIEDLDLSVGTYNFLKSVKINSLAELVKLDTHELVRFKNFTKKALIELEKYIQSRGLTFGMNLAEYGL